ncbi:MAG TPA: hypothetical protein ENK15_06160 [Thermopetrobacter sp.]|nr:hypothetical protein [Thermopetrobacter sp.]
MSTPFDGLPCLRRNEGVIPAATWNRWRRWRARFGATLELPLTCRPGTALVCTDDFWVMLDVTHGGAPLILWLQFQTQGRAALHADVGCFVQYYDYPGARFHDAALKELDERLRGDLEREAS